MPKTRKSLIAAFATFVATALVLLGGVTPAHAASGTISGDQGGYSTIYWSKSRSNLNAKNMMFVRVTNDGSTGYSNKFTFGIRKTTGHFGVFARTAQFTPSATNYKFHTDSGVGYIGPGTFYLSSSISGCMGPPGGCFGESYGFGTWSGTLQWNLVQP